MSDDKRDIVRERVITLVGELTEEDAEKVLIAAEALRWKEKRAEEKKEPEPA